MVKKKLLSVVLVASTICSMLLTGCGNDAGKTESGSTDTNTSTVAQTEEVVADDVEKPEKITIMVSGDFQATQANGQEEWIARWEELTVPIMMYWDRHLQADRRTGRISFMSETLITPDMQQKVFFGI